MSVIASDELSLALRFATDFNASKSTNINSADGRGKPKKVIPGDNFDDLFGG